MDTLLLAAAAVLGAILGSFINALSFRWGVSTMAGYSRCMSCNHRLGAIDLVPMLSYVFLCGRCRYCGTRISPQYPLVEAIGAVVVALVYLQTGVSAAFGFQLLVWMLLLFIAVYDCRHGIIPWSASILLSVCALGYVGYSEQFTVYSLAAGPVLALPLFLLWLLSRGRWMGLGDSVLELGLGWLLGLTMGLTALLFAFWLGAIVGIGLILARRGVTIKSEVPFAPFLILGAALSHFLHVDLFPLLPLILS